MKMEHGDNNKLRIVVFTQPDSLVIPKNIQKLIDCDCIAIKQIVVLKNSGSIANRKMLFIRGFGLFQSIKLLCAIGWIKIIDVLDRISLGKIFESYSIKSISMRNRIPYVTFRNPNEGTCLAMLHEVKPDVIVSFSAPSVFSPSLLEIPRLGCINLHCSLLPRYAGLLPSFWALYYGERETGATVHYMDDRIDNGAILGQVKVVIEPGMSMFQLIKSTKEAGGNLMRGALEELAKGESKVLPNDAANGSYFSWPEVSQIMEFRKRGGRLV